MTKLGDYEVRPGVTFTAPAGRELRWLYEEIFEHGGYEEIMLPKNPFIVDVGANVGLFCIFIKQLHPGARIHAFEPIPALIRALHINLLRYDIDDIEIEPCGLGEQREDAVEFTYYPLMPGNTTRYPHEKQLQKEVLAREDSLENVERQHRGFPVMAPVERLSSYLNPDQKVDLLKVDVEGAELDVLLGINPTQWMLIDQAIMEVQDLDNRLMRVCRELDRHGMDPQVRPSPVLPKDMRTFIVHATR
ncbi:FkbM family methyltransferase [Streptomyces tendae]|uniref:FkbM family methyltransferase n=1 Tax=Streptomyces tendae TaxID=1932 RepID=UPI0033EA7C65